MRLPRFSSIVPIKLPNDNVVIVIRLMLLLVATILTKTIQETYEIGLWPFLGLLMVALLLGGLLIRFFNFGDFRYFWLALALFLTTYLLWEWPGPGNHLYVFVYMCLILFFTLSNDPGHRLHLMQTNFTLLFVLILLMAVLQKAITPGYLDGTINAFWLVNSGYFKPLYFLSSSWTAVADGNYELLNHYYNETPMAVGPMVLQSPVNNLRLWGKILAWVIIAGELALPLLFLFKRSFTLKHMSLLLFIAITFLTRQESVFLSLLCIIGIAQVMPEKNWVRWCYILLLGSMQLLFVFDYGYM